MVHHSMDTIAEVLNGTDCSNVDATKATIGKVTTQMKRFQERVRKHIEDNYVDFMPNNDSSDLLLEEGEALVREADNLLTNIKSDTESAMEQAHAELISCMNILQEMSLGLRVAYRILKVDDLFQCIEDANASKDYLAALDLLSKLKTLIINNTAEQVDRVFQKCDCYDAIKVQYHIQSNMLCQNLQQRFENLVQFSEKQFPSSKCVTLQISKDENQLQDTVMALFQAQYNPIKLCNFLLDNCLAPLITRPVSMEYTEKNSEYIQLVLSYSLKELASSLRPSYSQVFESIKTLLNCFSTINVSVSSTQHVFSIIGDHIKEPLLKLIVDECLMHAIPDTMDELQESTLVEDVMQFENYLAVNFFINSDTDCQLSEFCKKIEPLFMDRFSKKLLDSAKEIMTKDLQDMTLIAEKNTPEDVASNPFLFPRCMLSKSTLELVKLLERILCHPQTSEGEDNNKLLSIITTIIDYYISEVPKIHKKFLESIPQQSALLYNNCMFFSQWVAKNSKCGTPTFLSLVKTLQSTGNKYLKQQIAYQHKVIMDILKEFDLTDTHSIGTTPVKLIRQCLRQLDLLKNVWQNVLPDNVYNTTFSDLLNDFCNEIIKRIMAMEDISATVANELSELIDVVLEKVPTFFKEKHDVVQIKSWMKLKQLKMILNASLQEITEQWCEGAGILTVNYRADEIRHLIRALFQNTDRRSKALAKII